VSSRPVQDTPSLLAFFTTFACAPILGQRSRLLGGPAYFALHGTKGGWCGSTEERNADQAECESYYLAAEKEGGRAIGEAGPREKA